MKADGDRRPAPSDIVPSSGLPLIDGSDLDAAFALHAGQAISRRQYLADIQALAATLPAAGPMLNTTANRYRFAVGLGAAMLRGHSNLLPPNHTPDTIERLSRLFPSAYGLSDDESRRVALPMVWNTPAHAALPATTHVPTIDPASLTAQVLTSGSTGEPTPHPKHWGMLALTMQSGARRLAEWMGRDDLRGVALVATVPPQHMYGFESTVLLAMLAGAAFDTERPFYPADIAAALARAPRPRMLVTTPFHLKTLLDAGVELPQIDLTLCATAPLSPQLAARAEAGLGAPLVEIYGCTEAGQVATRRTTAGPEWMTYEGLQLSGDGDHAVIHGGHVPDPTPLADVLEVIDPRRFRLLGRSNDLINIAGKRSSLSHLNYHLNTIEGVRDGAFVLPPERLALDGSPGVTRLAAFVVAPGVPHEHILHALRQRVDPAFLPRPIVSVPALPREPTGKLPAIAFAAWAAQRLAGKPLAAAPAAAPPAHEATLHVAADHPAFAGHFPGQPLLPGVVLLAEALEVLRAVPSLAARVGPAPRVGVVKFLVPVRPDSELQVRLFDDARALRFEVWCAGRLAASGEFEADTPA